MVRLNEVRAQGSEVRPALDLAQLLRFGFEDVDPDGLLSGFEPKLLRRNAR